MIIDNTKKILSILTRDEKRGALLVSALTAVIAAIEVLGVASIMPFIAVVANPDVIHSNQYLSAIYNLMGFSSDRDFLIALGICVFFFLIGSLLLKAGGFWLQTRYAHFRLLSISSRLLEAYMSQPYQWFLKHHSSQLSTSILDEVSKVVHGSIFPTLLIVSNFFVAALLLVLLIVVDPQLAITVFILLAGCYGILFLSTKNSVQRRGASARQANRARFKLTQEAFGGIKDVKIMGLENVYVSRYEEITRYMIKDQVFSKLLSTLPSFLLQGLIFGGMMLMVLYLLKRMGDMESAAPVIALYALGGYKLMPALQGIYARLTDIKFCQKATDMLVKDMSVVYKDNLAADVVRHDRLSFIDSVSMKDVSYSYNEGTKGKLALSGVNLTIEKNATVGFVGRSGSGKSTTADLILGLISPLKGEVMIGNLNVKDLARNELAGVLGYVPQSIFLADDTVAANIAFGREHADIDMDAVVTAAKIADIHDFIERDLHQGYETFVGERGVRLSGGQRQRIGIARALYHDPEILVMDEATSALDNVTEQAVMNAVAKLKSEKTIILIAHRLSTVKGCDRIFIFENGQVVEEGSFEQLEQVSERFRVLSLLKEAP